MDVKVGLFAGLGGDFEVASVQADYLTGKAESDSGAFGAGGEEGDEDVVEECGIDAGAVVGYGDADQVVG